MKSILLDIMSGVMGTIMLAVYWIKDKMSQSGKRGRIIAAGSAMVCILIFLIPVIFGNQISYSKAFSLRNKGKYAEAAEIFNELGEYKDSSHQVEETKKAQKYDIAMGLFNDENYSTAYKAFCSVDDYKDGEEYAEKCIDYMISG